MTQSIDPVRSDAAPQDERPVSAWSLIKPYWVSSEWKVAWGLLITIVAINLCVVWINVKLNKWNAQFYNALQSKDVHEFPNLLMQFSALAFGFIILAVYGRYLRQMLGFRWRQWLTDRILGQWLGDRAFYRIERDHLADNPDQRITDDLQSFATTTLALSLDLLSTVVTLVSFITILWSLAGALSVSLGATPITIPGYMVWAAAVRSGRLGDHPEGRSPARVDQLPAAARRGRLPLRADPRARERRADRVLRRRKTETANAGPVHAHSRQLVARDEIHEAPHVRAELLRADRDDFPARRRGAALFAGAFSFGVLMQISSAFNTVSDSFSWFINSYGTLVEWRATVNRLREFKRVMGTSHLKESLSPATEHGGINLHYVDAAKLSTSSLKLALPNGTALANIGNVTIEPGSRWLVVGKSGSGKSTFMRALAGLWPFGDGAIDAPVGARMMFVPQTSYLPIGTLKAALTYPAAPDAFTDDACRDALRACHLEGYVDRLDETGHWTRVLSPGEQQRLAGARVLLHKPDFLFLDEATSALDADNEARLYHLFAERLPKAAIVSIAHREALAEFPSARSTSSA
jgi:putative ATP-binding cassette transporter